MVSSANHHNYFEKENKFPNLCCCKSKGYLLYGFSVKTIVLVGIYFINNSKGRTYFNGRLDFQTFVVVASKC